MTDDEVIVELEYMIERGIDGAVAIVFHTILGCLKSGKLKEFALFSLSSLCVEFARMMVKLSQSGVDNE